MYPAAATRLKLAATQIGSRTSSSVCEQTAKSNCPVSNGHGSRSQMSRWTHVSGPNRSR